MTEFLTADELSAVTAQVNDAMTAVFRTTITPLASSSDEHVRFVGTGTIFNIDGMRVILTCRHVIEEGGTDYGFFGASETYVAGNQVVCSDKLDAALISIPDFIWDRQKHRAGQLLPASFARDHQPVENEVFFICGFAGENSHYGFGNLESTATCYAVQENQVVEPDEKFFYLHWRPRQVLVTPVTDEDTARHSKAEDARGLSGSLVWDTNFIRGYYEEEPWSPTDARIRGMVVNWDQHSHSLVVRRIEDVWDWIALTLGRKQ